MTIENEKRGKLTAIYKLVVVSEKRILLDYETAPKPPYMQLIKGESGDEIFTFLNHHKNGINFYDYETGNFIKRVEYVREGPDAIYNPGGYFIKRMDSIYVFNRGEFGLVLTDNSGHVNQRIPLADMSARTWSMYYPQYQFYTINSIFEHQGELFLTGMSPFGIVDSLIHKFHFTACVDLNVGSVNFIHTYPEELYGSNTNWIAGHWLMQPYPAISPTGEFIYSFPMSHDVHITHRDKNTYKTIYAGSNIAGAIRSIDWNGIPPEEVILTHTLTQDLYAGILHDPYRKVYYRFMLKGNPDATIETAIEEKPIVVIVMDEQFNYMGETIIGTGEKWIWKNSFVSSEGLVMEYFDLNMDYEEQYMILKTFSVEKINK